MSKIVQLNLVGVKYAGEAIGDDIRIEIRCLNKFLVLDKRIKAGTEATFDVPVGEFAIDQISSVPINITIIEKDLVFNDVGSGDFEIQFDLNDVTPKSHTFDVEVKERRGLSVGNSTAIFTASIEALVREPIYYLPMTDDAWFVVKLEGEDVSLPSYLKVLFNRKESGREYFMVLEGALQDKLVSTKLDSDGETHLIQDNPQIGAVHIKYSISKKTFDLNGKTYLTTDAPDNPWKVGFYDIEIPDFPHPGGLNYPNVKFAKTWFRIGHDGDRYLHTGRYSLGCITVTEQNIWDELCEFLMKSRKGDSRSIGVLEVTN